MAQSAQLVSRRDIVEREVQLDDIDAGSPSTPSGDRRCTCSPAARPRPRRALAGCATRCDLQPGVGDRDVRVEPGRRCGDGVDGHECVGGEAVLLAVGSGAFLDRAQQVGVGRAEVGAGAGRAVVAGARRPTAGSGSTRRRRRSGRSARCRRRHRRAGSASRRPCRGRRPGRSPVLSSRVGDAADQREHDDDQERRPELAKECAHVT